MIRPSTNDYFFNIIKEIAKRSTCKRRQVGAILVKDNRILTTGYNGSPPGKPHCIDEGVGCSKPEHGKNFEDCKAIHAEMNCILQAAIFGIPIKNSILYCTTEPCKLCKLHLEACGINTYFYIDKYNIQECETTISFEL